jgi:hypothetical protein
VRLTQPAAPDRVAMNHPQQMAQMAAMNANGGPVDGTPMMGNMPHPKGAPAMDPREQLNTYIYDYFLRNEHFAAAQAMLDSQSIKMGVGPEQKLSPKIRTNGVDAMEEPRPDTMPQPKLPQNQLADNSFLLDWWVQFWDIYQATKNRVNSPTKNTSYINHTRVSLSRARPRRGIGRRDGY